MQACDFETLTKEFTRITMNNESPKTAIVTFDPVKSKWRTDREYNELNSSYIFNSSCKYFNPNMGGSSIFASCLDGTDHGIRLDYYIHDWSIVSCIIFDSVEESKSYIDGIIKRCYK